jgi:hypothetical protein
LDLRLGRPRAFSPLVQGKVNPWGVNLFNPNQDLEELSAKPGALILNSWNSEKIIAFFENPLLLFRLKERCSKAPSLVSQP